MTRWDWTWEDRAGTDSPGMAQAETAAETSATDTGPSGNPVPGSEHGPPAAKRADPLDPPWAESRPGDVFRRRRASAAVVAIALFAILIAAIGSRGRHHGHAAHAVATTARRVSPDAIERRAHELKAENRAIDSVLAYTPALVRGGENGEEVALTFDDGPGPYTEQLVAMLNRLHVRATFFTVGSQEQYFSTATIDELNSGDVVADHSESHPMMSGLSAHDQHEQLFEPMARIELLGGPRPRLFRPPYGAFNATTLRQLHHLHLLMVLWSVDTGDYQQPGSGVIAQRALAGAKPGAIILMHDAGGDRSQTIAALPAIVRGLRKRGLHPVTVPRLLLDDPPPAGQPIPRSLTGG